MGTSLIGMNRYTFFRFTIRPFSAAAYSDFSLAAVPSLWVGCCRCRRRPRRRRCLRWRAACQLMFFGRGKRRRVESWQQSMNFWLIFCTGAFWVGVRPARHKGCQFQLRISHS